MTVFSDNFNRADGPLGSDYDTASGWNSLAVVSNEAGAGGGGLNGNTVATSVADFANDQEASVDVTAAGGSDWFGLLVRWDPVANTGYAIPSDGIDHGERALHRYDGDDTGTIIGSTHLTAEAGDSFTLRAEGTTISVFKNGAEIDSVTDSTYSSGQPGLFYRRNNANVSRMDNFVATDELSSGDPVGQGTFALSLNVALSGSGTSTQPDATGNGTFSTGTLSTTMSGTGETSEGVYNIGNGETWPISLGVSFSGTGQALQLSGTGTFTQSLTITQTGVGELHEITGTGTFGQSLTITQTGVGTISTQQATGDGTFSQSLTITQTGTGSLTLKQLLLTSAEGRELRDETGSLINLSGVAFEWYDKFGNTTGDPVESGTVDITNGEAVISLPSSSLTSGDIGTLILYHPVNNDANQIYRLPILVT